MFSDTTPVTASPPGIQATEPAPTTEGGTGPAPTEGTAPGSDVPTAPPERKSAPETTHETYRVHWIQWGDTLSQISVDSGVSVQRLAEVNGISNVDLIYADDQLLIPYLLIPVE
ncbi:hypothetical protein ANMWB30_24660 [Arthrobacter sp. MWB30]|nr:hypothetical protein ANMWB30_24660 [Arthrobacter sp. MWB30]